MQRVVPSSMVRPSAGARIVSALVLHASAQPSISAGAQPAAVADAAARPQDRGVFERQIDTIVIPFYRCGAAKRQPVGPLTQHSAYTLISAEIRFLYRRYTMRAVDRCGLTIGVSAHR